LGLVASARVGFRESDTVTELRAELKALRDSGTAALLASEKAKAAEIAAKAAQAASDHFLKDREESLSRLRPQLDSLNAKVEQAVDKNAKLETQIARLETEKMFLEGTNGKQAAEIEKQAAEIAKHAAELIVAKEMMTKGEVDIANHKYDLAKDALSDSRKDGARVFEQHREELSRLTNVYSDHEKSKAAAVQSNQQNIMQLLATVHNPRYNNQEHAAGHYNAGPGDANERPPPRNALTDAR
jgi:chromosome segregation ATPase